MWAEFVDYWVAVPGQRGVKLDWLATWRNDVRRKLERETANVQTNQRHPGGDYGASKDRFRAAYAKLNEFADGADEPSDRAGRAGLVEVLPSTRRN